MVRILISLVCSLIGRLTQYHGCGCLRTLFLWFVLDWDDVLLAVTGSIDNCSIGSMMYSAIPPCRQVSACDLDGVENLVGKACALVLSPLQSAKLSSSSLSSFLLGRSSGTEDVRSGRTRPFTEPLPPCTGNLVEWLLLECNGQVGRNCELLVNWLEMEDEGKVAVKNESPGSVDMSMRSVRWLSCDCSSWLEGIAIPVDVWKTEDIKSAGVAIRLWVEAWFTLTEVWWSSSESCCNCSNEEDTSLWFGETAKLSLWVTGSSHFSSAPTRGAKVRGTAVECPSLHPDRRLHSQKVYRAWHPYRLS